MAVESQGACRVVRVGAGRGYDVTIGAGLREQAARFLPEDARTRHAVIVTDDVVEGLFMDAVMASFMGAGLEVSSFVLSHGEASKSVGTYAALLEYLAARHATRDDVVVALGGGVVGDVAGFAAATYMRGCRFMQMPTTLLAAVDSSVGGKTGIDLKAGKNLAGAFYQPDAVVCDVDCLATLPRGEFANGMAEALKYGVLCDAGLFEDLQGDAHADLPGIVARCVDIKRAYVEADEREGNERRFLNLGHTFGHAIEACSGYAVPHGSAVAVGMVMAARVAHARGLADPGLATRLAEAFLAADLPVAVDIPADALARAALSDKKRRGERIVFVLPAEVGRCELVPIPVGELPDVFALACG